MTDTCYWYHGRVPVFFAVDPSETVRREAEPCKPQIIYGSAVSEGSTAKENRSGKELREKDPLPTRNERVVSEGYMSLKKPVREKPGIKAKSPSNCSHSNPLKFIKTPQHHHLYRSA